ncbi:MAG: hypothetical protein V4488_15390 [Pseudomonadota bacterium]
MQNASSLWPDKSNFSNIFAASAGNGRLKEVREVKSGKPGISARVVEFHHKYLDVPYVEHRKAAVAE